MVFKILAYICFQIPLVPLYRQHIVCTSLSYLKNGIPSHDTIQRVMGMIRPENLQQLQRKWLELLDSNYNG